MENVDPTRALRATALEQRKLPTERWTVLFPDSPPPVKEYKSGPTRMLIWKKEGTPGTETEDYELRFCHLVREGDLWKESTRFPSDLLEGLEQVSGDAWRWICDTVRLERAKARGKAQEN